MVLAGIILVIKKKKVKKVTNTNKFNYKTTRGKHGNTNCRKTELLNCMSEHNLLQQVPH